MKECLKTWNKESFGNIILEKRKLEKQIEELQIRTMEEWYSKIEKNMEQELMQELIQHERKEEIMWQHKSRKLWLKEGDQNTSSFHKSTIQNRQQIGRAHV